MKALGSDGGYRIAEGGHSRIPGNGMGALRYRGCSCLDTNAHSRPTGGGLLLVGVITYDALRERHSIIVIDTGEHDAFSSAPDALSDEFDRALSDKERQVLRMLADGAATKQIARCLETSMALASRRARWVVKKLGKRSRAAAVAHAAKVGLLEPTMRKAS